MNAFTSTLWVIAVTKLALLPAALSSDNIETCYVASKTVRLATKVQLPTQVCFSKLLVEMYPPGGFLEIEGVISDVAIRTKAILTERKRNANEVYVKAEIYADRDFDGSGGNESVLLEIEFVVDNQGMIISHPELIGRVEYFRENGSPRFQKQAYREVEPLEPPGAATNDH